MQKLLSCQVYGVPYAPTFFAKNFLITFLNKEKIFKKIVNFFIKNFKNPFFARLVPFTPSLYLRATHVSTKLAQLGQVGAIETRRAKKHVFRFNEKNIYLSQRWQARPLFLYTANIALEQVSAKTVAILFTVTHRA